MSAAHEPVNPGAVHFYERVYALQRALLRTEGITFRREGRVDVRRHICDLVALMAG